MRHERPPPLPERDKGRTIEYWRNQPHGSVRILQGQAQRPQSGNAHQTPREPRRQTQDNRESPREVRTQASTPSENASRTVGNATDDSSSANEGVSRMAPFVEEPLRNDDGTVCLLTTSHYIVSGSVGPGPSAMRPFHIAFDTGSGYNVIRLSDLPSGWER